MGEWVSVKDRLPYIETPPGENMHSGTGGSFLVAFPMPYRHFKIAKAVFFPYAGKKWRLEKNNGLPGKDITHKVTHWQPLPEPPVVESKQPSELCNDCVLWACLAEGYCLKEKA